MATDQIRRFSTKPTITTRPTTGADGPTAGNERLSEVDHDSSRSRAAGCSGTTIAAQKGD